MIYNLKARAPMSGLQVGLGTEQSQSHIREMFPSVSLPNPRMNYTVEAVQNEMQKKLSLQDEKVSPAIGKRRSGDQEPRALVIAGPSGVGKGTLIEVCSFDFTFNVVSMKY